MQHKDYFISKMFHRLLVPSLLSSVGFALADMADAIVLGQRMGETGLAAISLCLPLYMLINAVMDGLSIGGSIRFSQLLGAGRREEAVACFNRVLLTAALAGIGMGLLANLFPDRMLSLLGAAPGDGMVYEACGTYARILMAGAPLLILNVILSSFLRNDNRERLASIGFLIGNGVDFSLNILLVLILDLGTAGAAVSTLIGSGVAVCCYLPGVLDKDGILRFAPAGIDLGEVFSCFRVGLATSVQHLFHLAFLLLVNRLLMRSSGEGGVAVFDLVYNASFLILYLFNGTAEAAQPLISTFTGERSEEDIRGVRVLALFWGLAAGVAAAALAALFAGQICLVFGLSGELISPGARALRIYCSSAACAGVNILLESYFQAREETAPAFFLTSLRSFVLLIPCAALLARTSVENIWLMYPITEAATLACFLLLRRRLVPQREDVLPPERRMRVTMGSEEEISALMEGVSEFCERWQSDLRQGYFVTMAVEEISMSFFHKAMAQVPDGRIRVTVIALEDGSFELRFLANAVTFDPFSLKSVQVKEADDTDLDMDAVGMAVIREKASEFMFRRCQGINSLVARFGK